MDDGKQTIMKKAGNMQKKKAKTLFISILAFFIDFMSHLFSKTIAGKVFP